MQSTNLPGRVIERAEQRWARILAREAIAWKKKRRKTPFRIVSDGWRAIQVEVRLLQTHEAAAAS